MIVPPLPPPAGHSPRCVKGRCMYCDAQPTPGCVICRTPDTATVDIYNGRRCTAHAPVYDPQTAVNLLMAGWHDTARAYVRGWER